MKRLVIAICVFLCFIMLFQGCDNNQKSLEEIDVEQVYKLKFPEDPYEFFGSTVVKGTAKYIYRLDWKHQNDASTLAPTVTQVQRENQAIISVEHQDMKTEDKIGGLLHDQDTDTMWSWVIIEKELVLTEYDNDLAVKSSFSLPVREQLEQPIWVVEKIKGGFLFADGEKAFKIAEDGKVEIVYELENKLVGDLCMVGEKTLLLSEVAKKHGDSVLRFVDLSDSANPKEIKKENMDGAAKFVQQIENGNILIETYGGKVPAYYILNSNTMEIDTEIKIDGFNEQYSGRHATMLNEHDVYVHIAERSKGADMGIIKSELFLYRDGEIVGNVALKPTEESLDEFFIDGDKLVFYDAGFDYVVEHSCEIKDILK